MKKLLIFMLSPLLMVALLGCINAPSANGKPQTVQVVTEVVSASDNNYSRSEKDTLSTKSLNDIRFDGWTDEN